MQSALRLLPPGNNQSIGFGVPEGNQEADRRAAGRDRIKGNMTRKGEINRRRLNREWPHHLALPAEKVRGLANAELVRGFAATLSAASLIPSAPR